MPATILVNESPVEVCPKKVNESPVEVHPKKLRDSSLILVSIFVMSYFVLFMGMTLSPTIFDEGIILTGAMRVLAGLIPHQDFYSPYGPGQYYTIAGLFKLFGPYMLVERMYDLFLKALIATFVYVIVSSYCRRSIAVCTTIVTVVWLLSLSLLAATAVIPVSLLNLVACTLILPVFSRPVSTKRMFLAGVVTGVATLFRYDTGVALLGIQACVIAIATYLQIHGLPSRLRSFVSTFWSCLVGFSLVTGAALLYYLSRASLYPFIYNIIIYPARYYNRGRHLPFPAIHWDWRWDDKVGIYLLIPIIAISFYVALGRWLPIRGERERDSQVLSTEQATRGFLVTFSLLALVMFFKGFVRVSLLQMYLSILPSLLLVAVLFQHKSALTRLMRTFVTLLAFLFVFSACLASLREVRSQHLKHVSILESAALSVRGALPQTRAAWCKTRNSITAGLCFLPDDDHIQVIEFIAAHTRPDQRLFIGQTRHDIVYANDNFTYFATQRLPATRWSIFDPDLVNRSDIQTQIIHDLEVFAPPYIALDTEFDQVREPNDSSISSRVTLLDDYIHSRYQRVETFGEMSIWQRSQTPSLPIGNLR